MINLESIRACKDSYLNNKPFHHCVVDNFFEGDLANGLEREFPDYDSSQWHVYKNQIEDKKTLNNWNVFGNLTYRAFSQMCGDAFVNELSNICGVKLYPDIGLHGGGWHIHGDGGNLNPHLDYSIHPKMGLQRKINIIVYLSADLKTDHGGQLGLWSSSSDGAAPEDLMVEVEPVFNRAIIFDTTQNSWHGMSRQLKVPPGVFRKSLAIYYLCEPPVAVDSRGKALFAPRQEQKGNREVLELIEKRSSLQTASSVYVRK